MGRPGLPPGIYFPLLLIGYFEGMTPSAASPGVTLASLNHPNIAQIYGFERADGGCALVMELVEGPTLADRIHVQGGLATWGAS